MKIHTIPYVALAAALLIASGCNSDTSSPTKLLNRYFSSAAKQDYATAYTCYYSPYKVKISREEYIKHRKDASLLQSYKIVNVQEKGNTAQADVQLTFAPSEKLKRKEPVTVSVKEDLVKEGGEWRVKVW
ncbi:MAG TPA: hypothetical protein VI298_16835 [Geobacteraceae bacterium]